MQNGTRLLAVSLILAAATFAIRADTGNSDEAAEIQLQLGRLLFDDGRYQDSLDAYQRALQTDDPARLREARSGVVQAALRVAEFGTARREAENLVTAWPDNPDVLSLYGDALWASGLFDDAEQQYRQALAIAPRSARAHNGIGRALLARSQFDRALSEAEAAIALSPRDLELHHTAGSIYERMHRYEEAAAALTNYVNLLPNKDQSTQAAWARAEVRFLRSFGQKVPFLVDSAGGEAASTTVPFRVVNDKVVIRAKVNNGSAQDFVVDTGSESTVITRATSQRLRVEPITYTLSAGVGDVGFRGLMLARIDALQIGTLRLRNIPCLIKDPPLSEIPVKETESVSPIALGLSMTIDYKTHELTIGRHLPEEPADFELPLRVYRLATVRGVVDRAHGANFVVDTGGQVISISQATANALGRPAGSRRIALKVYGTSGWDRDAFLMPDVDLMFERLHFANLPVAVLNLRAPSVLLGFQLGGIVGHKFLSRYRVRFDLERSVLGLKTLS